MKKFPHLCRPGLAGYTRRELLIGAAVVLALMAVTAREVRHRPPPSCGVACSPCGGDAAGGLDRWIAAQTNATPGTLGTVPASR